MSLPTLNFPQADAPLPAQNPDALVAEIERLRRFEVSAEHARSSLETAIVAAVERERAAIAAWLRYEPETLRVCSGHRHTDGKPCTVLSPMTVEEIADAIERGDYPSLLVK